MDKKVYSILLELAKANSAEVRARGDLKPRNNDSDDFVSISVSGLEKMLEGAYTVGTMVDEGMSEYPEYKYVSLISGIISAKKPEGLTVLRLFEA